MRNLKSAFSIFFVLLLCSCAGSVDPTKLTLDPGEERGVIMMKVTSSARDYNIIVTGIDREEQKAKGGIIGAGGNFEISSTAPLYIAKKFRPGSYAFQEFVAQTYWSICFHDDTLSFDVKPGEILYLGEFDVSAHYRQLASNVRMNGDSVKSSNSSRSTYFDAIASPKIIPSSRSDAALADVKKYVAENMPNVNAVVTLAEFQEAKFGTGRNLTGGKMCNGF